MRSGTISVDSINDDAYWNTSIPENITRVFSAQTDGTTLSGPFDIQFRTWNVAVDDDRNTIDRGQSYTQGSYRSLDSLILHNKIEALEGVIADTVTGGVGFRNHTAPSGLPYGGAWSEDITWIEPVTECVNTNLTFEISLGSSSNNITNFDLIDEGGFVNAPREFNFDMKTSQDLDLKERAQRVALLSNVLLAYQLNVSFPNNKGPRNTSLNRHFKLDSSAYKPSLYSIKLSALLPDFLDIPSSPLDAYNSTGEGGDPSSYTPGKNITRDDWSSVQDLCSGGTGKRLSNITNVAVQCGYLFGAPRPAYQGDVRIFQPFSVWHQSLYVCSSSERASVKSVEFSYNASSDATQSLENLRITNVKDKEYVDKSSSWPAWAVERTYRSIFDTSPLWGMVAEEDAGSSDLTVHRGPKFFLPATDLLLTTITAVADSLAAPKAFAAALMSVYQDSMTSTSSNSIRIADYTGRDNVALNAKWQELSASAATANKIINLIYTEIVATATVGTKSAAKAARNGGGAGGRPRAEGAGAAAAAARPGPDTPALVTVYSKRLHFDYRYGVPAAIVLLIVLLVAIALFACLVTFRFKPAEFAQLLNQTSTGRLVTNLLHPHSVVRDAKTKRWVVVAGGMKVRYPFYVAGIGGGGGGEGDPALSTTTGMGTCSDSTSRTSQVEGAYQPLPMRDVGVYGTQQQQQEQQQQYGGAWQDSNGGGWHHSPAMADPGVSAVGVGNVGLKKEAQAHVRQI